MTKSAFNEKVRSLAKQEAALQARLEAAESSQDELIEAIARVQDLMDLGLDFDLEDEEGVLISGAAHLLSEHDAQVLTRHRKVLAKVLDRKSVVWGKSVSVRVDLGGRRLIENKKATH